VKFLVQIVGFSPPPQPPSTTIFFLVFNFLNLAIFVGKKMEKIVQIQEKCKQQKKLRSQI
jgi:hypothetical protein